MFSLETLPDVIIEKIRLYVIFTPSNNKKFRNAIRLWCENMKLAFRVYGHISLWDTKNVTMMHNLFYCERSFNSVISSWDVSNVESMEDMFLFARSFDQNISNWDVSSETDKKNMFEDT